MDLTTWRFKLKARPIIIRRLVVTAKRQGKSFRLVAREFCLPIGTVKTWCSRADETPHCEEKTPQHETHLGKWMQSLHHDSAHFVVDGQAACSAKVTEGMRWFPHDGCVRRCMRCMKHEQSDKGQRNSHSDKTL